MHNASTLSSRLFISPLMGSLRQVMTIWRSMFMLIHWPVVSESGSSYIQFDKALMYIWYVASWNTWSSHRLLELIDYVWQLSDSILHIRDCSENISGGWRHPDFVIHQCGGAQILRTFQKSTQISPNNNYYKNSNISYKAIERTHWEFKTIMPRFSQSLRFCWWK